MAKATIRPYRPADREAVRHVCCETGLEGDPIDPLFSDRQLFADLLTVYYTDFEPETCLVAEREGRVVGYLAGCRRWLRHALVQPLVILAVAMRAAVRLAAGRYDRPSRAFLGWGLLRAWRELPRGPLRAAHFHFNLLPAHRDGALGLRMGRRFLAESDGAGVRRIWGRMEGPADDRRRRFWKRYGFRPIARGRVTRLEGLGAGPALVTVFLRTTQDGERRAGAER